MLALIARLAGDLRQFAPEVVADPKRSLYRIYRDTRFSDDKTPLKTNAAAVFPPRGFPPPRGRRLLRGDRAGWVWMGGGLYMPPPPSLYAIRERIAGSHPSCIASSPRASSAPCWASCRGIELTRVPRGYLKDHPAAEYLRYKQFLGFRNSSRALPPATASTRARAHVQGAHAAGAIPQHGDPRRCRSGSGPADTNAR
jgi:uncharacterized protein (TIGR02453 family)